MICHILAWRFCCVLKIYLRPIYLISFRLNASRTSLSYLMPIITSFGNRRNSTSFHYNSASYFVSKIFSIRTQEKEVRRKREKFMMDGFAIIPQPNEIVAITSNWHNVGNKIPNTIVLVDELFCIQVTEKLR